MGRPGLPAHTARARFGKPIERWGRKASGPEQSWIAGLPAGPQRYLRAHAGLPNTLSLRELPFQPSLRGQLPDGNADSERVIDMSEAKRVKGDLHMEAHQSLGRAVWAGLAAAALATTAHAQVDPG